MIPEAAGDRRKERGTYEEHWTDHLSLPQRSRPVSDCAFEKAEGSGGGSELLEHFRLGTWTERALCGNVSVHLQNSRNLGLYRGLLRQQSRRSPLRAECRRKGHGVISFIEMLRHSSQYLKPEHAPTNVSAALAPAATRHLRLYNVTASTGTGSFLDSDSYTTLEGDVKKAGSADFAVTMSDDSMEPLFHSHEMVLVHQQDTLEAETSGSLRSTAASVSESSKATGAEFPWYRQPPSTVRSRSAPESTPSGSSGRCSRRSSAGAQAFFCTVPWRRTGTGTPAPFHSPVLIHRGQSWQETLLSPCGTQ